MFISLFCVCLFYGLVPELNVLMMMMIWRRQVLDVGRDSCLLHGCDDC